MSRWYDAFAKKIKTEKKSKYKNEKALHSSGRSFDSKLERARYHELLSLEKAGQIRELQCQVQVYLSDADILYKPDFKYFDVDLNDYAHEDVKGFETDVWRIKRRLWLAYGPTILRVMAGTTGNIRLKETLTPKKK